jgi:esterase/lipase
LVFAAEGEATFFQHAQRADIVLGDVVREHLPRVHRPLLLLYSEGDQTVMLENRDLILGRVNSGLVEQHTLQHSDHILPQDSERETVFTLVTDFVKRRTSG